MCKSTFPALKVQFVADPNKLALHIAHSKPIGDETWSTQFVLVSKIINMFFVLTTKEQY